MSIADAAIATIRSSRRDLARAIRHHPFAWRYLLNAAPALSYALDRHTLPPEAARILADLNRDGIALSSIPALGVAPALFAAVSDEVDRLEHAKADELAVARHRAGDPATVGAKMFNVELLGTPTLDVNDVFCRLALERNILDVANAYFGMFTRLRYYNIWHTLATSGAPRESQLWHRDREDFYILKVFVYLADVTDEAGPFIYAPGTHPKGRVRQEPEFGLEGHVRRTTDAQMNMVVPARYWITARGPRTTVVFADTRGYHKGGLARGSDRLMYTCMFTSRVSQSRELFDRQGPLPHLSDPAAAFAVGAR